MPDLIVIVPSRGRPAAAVEVAQAFKDTCTANTRLVFAVDDDDNTRIQYVEALYPWPRTQVLIAPAPSTMVKTLNAAASREAGQAFALAFMGDDHRPRTKGWDAVYLDALHELGTGIVYGNDLLQHERIPTQVAMTADIVRALGYMAPRTLTHLFVDDYWKALGEGADCLRYLPDVIVEHLHPYAGKAVWDEGHLRVNAPAMYVADQAAYSAYAEEGCLATDVAEVRALVQR